MTVGVSGLGDEEHKVFWGPQKWSLRLWMRLLSRYLCTATSVWGLKLAATSVSRSKGPQKWSLRLWMRLLSRYARIGCAAASAGMRHRCCRRTAYALVCRIGY